MKTPLISSLAACVLAAALPAVSAAQNGGGSVQVNFVQPEKFTDVRDDHFGSEKAREAYLAELKEHLEEEGSRRLSSGQTLTVEVTDVDMAGDFEPWRGPSFNDVRIVKDIYPPRINLAFRLTGANGQVVAAGERQLRDLAFLMNVDIRRDDPLRHEKRLLGDWLRRELRSAGESS